MFVFSELRPRPPRRVPPHSLTSRLEMVASCGPTEPDKESCPGRRVPSSAAEPPVCAPSTRRRVLSWRARAKPEATPLLPRRAPGKTGADVSRSASPRLYELFLSSRFGRLALGVLVGAVFSLAVVGFSSRDDDARSTSLSHTQPPPGGAVAFLFLTRGPSDGHFALPHDHLWARYVFPNHHVLPPCSARLP